MDRATQRTERTHATALSELQREFEHEASAVWALMRQARQRKAAMARNLEALRAKRSGLENELRTLGPRTDARIHELHDEVVRVHQKLHDARRQQYEMQAAAVDSDWAGDALRRHLQEAEDRRAALKVAAATGQEYVTWLQDQLDDAAQDSGKDSASVEPTAPRHRRSSIAKGRSKRKAERSSTAAAAKMEAPVETAAPAPAPEPAGPSPTEASEMAFDALGTDLAKLRAIRLELSRAIKQVVQLDAEMQHELRCPECGQLLREPVLNEFGETLCRRCINPELVAFELAVPNQLIATLAGRQDFKSAARDASGMRPDA